MGDYARSTQPQTLARRPASGSAASPDVARLKGARFVNTPEPEKELKLNAALIKQLTGGDKFTGRFLRENSFEFAPEFKMFINTNHLPKISDKTVFSSGRVKLIPFDRHFTPDEQDTGLKKIFRQGANMSGILNWLIEGYQLLRSEGLSVPEKVQTAIDEYGTANDNLGAFFSEYLVPMEDNRLKTSELYKIHSSWAKNNGFDSMSSQSFVGELRERYTVKHDYIKGNTVVGFDLKK